ncbi:hypothetical protein KKB55_01535 [Myxococcota bacterium]|nr:hypothetical protein [Myxococcota bacterium]
MKYCYRCDNSVEYENFEEENFVASVCNVCFNVIDISLLRSINLEENQSALGRVNVVKKQVVIAPIVEKPVRSNLRPKSKDNDEIEDDAPDVSLMGDEPDVSMFEGMGASAEIREAQLQARKERSLDYVFIVHQSDKFRSMLSEEMKHQLISKNIFDFNQNSQFISSFTAFLSSKRSPSLIILDVGIKDIPSIQTSFSLRAIESAFKAKKHTPILLLDHTTEDVSASLKQIGGARRLEINAEDPPERAIARLVTILSKLISRSTPTR